MTTALFFLIGLFFGSFANVISLRLHSKKSGIFWGHSECPKCGHLLSWWENLPVISFLILRGKCRKCRDKISIQYPAVELFFGFLFAGTAHFVGTENPILFGFSLFLVFALGILTISDLRFLEIPDEVSLPAIFLSAVAAIFSVKIPLEKAIFGAIVAYGFFALQIFLPAALAAVREKNIRIFRDGFLGVLIFPIWLFFAIFGAGKWFEKKIHFEKMAEIPAWIGGGDLRLAIIIGLALGPAVGLFSIFLGYFFGAIVAVPMLFAKKNRGKKIPLGPFLAAGAIAGIWAGDALFDAYLRFLGF